MRKIALAMLAAIVTACSTPSGPPVKTSGGALVNASGMTLYTFDKDVAGSGRSVCNGQCAVTWPPLMAAAGAKPEGNYSLVTREGGGMQWAYKGKPLYTFLGDNKPNDMNGKGMNGVWQVATP